jgi:hypothetical protein
MVFKGRKLTSDEWRLPEAPVPSKPDYSRIGNIEDGRIIKQADKKRLIKNNSGIDYADPEIYVNIFYLIIILIISFLFFLEICN